MKYVAQRFFNTYSPGDEVPEPKESWIESGLVLLISEKEEFMQAVSVDEEIESLDPEKPKRGKK